MARLTKSMFTSFVRDRIHRRIGLLWSLPIVLVFLFVVAIATMKADVHNGSTPTQERRATRSRVMELIANDLDRSQVHGERSENGVILDQTEPVLDGANDRALLRVRILAREDGDPLSGVALRVIPKDPAKVWTSASIESGRGRLEVPPRPSRMPLSNSDGWAEIDVLACVDLVVVLPSVKYGPGSVDVPGLNPLECREIVVEIASKDDIELVGRTVDAQSHKPIVNAAIGIGDWPSDGVDVDRVSKTATTDLDGVFTVSAASWRSDVAFVVAPGYGPAAFAIGRGHETHGTLLEIPLVRAATVVATVYGTGECLLSGASVSVTVDPSDIPMQRGLGAWFRGPTFRRIAVTDVNGHCGLSDLPPETPFFIRVSHPAHPDLVVPCDAGLAAGETRTLELRLSESVIVRGRILDQYGRPAVSERVWCGPASRPARHLFLWIEGQANKQVAETVTDSNGAFMFRAVAPGGWWIGPAPHPDQEAVTPSPDRIAPVAEFVVLNRHDGVRHLDIRSDRGLYLRGRVVDPSGLGVENAPVLAHALFDIDSWVGTEATKEGSFTLGPLPAGEWRVSAVAGDQHENAAVQARSGSSDIVLRLDASGTIKGRVVGLLSSGIDNTDIAVSRRTDDGQGATIVKDDGTFEFARLGPGLYDIVVSTRDGLVGVRAGVELQSGAIVEGVEVVAIRGARLRMRLGPAAQNRAVRVSQNGVLIAWVSGLDSPDAIVMLPGGTALVELYDYGRDNSSRSLVYSETITAVPGREVSIDFSKKQ